MDQHYTVHKSSFPVEEVSESMMVNAFVSKVDDLGVKSSTVGANYGRDNGVVSLGAESGRDNGVETTNSKHGKLYCAMTISNQVVKSSTLCAQFG